MDLKPYLAGVLLMYILPMAHPEDQTPKKQKFQFLHPPPPIHIDQRDEVSTSKLNFLFRKFFYHEIFFCKI